MNRLFCLTMDLEAAVSGILEEDYSILEDTSAIESFLDGLNQRGVPLTVFVVGEILERFPRVIEIFRKKGCEFHCHSHTHDPQAPDSEAEIAACREAFQRAFGHPPRGYRAPQGRISDSGVRHLEAQGFAFDSSVFPSYYPNPFRYLFRNRKPHYIRGGNLLEIPFTAISPLRVTLSISWIKLLGWRAYRSLLKISSLPGELVFGTHLHDFFLSRSQLSRLPRFWRFIYSRNRGRGEQLLYRALDYFQERGVEFTTISSIYKRYEKSADASVGP